MILGSSDEDTRDNPDTIPEISTQDSALAENQHNVPFTEPVEDPVGLGFDENLTLGDALQRFQNDSFLAFGGDQESSKYIIMARRFGGMAVNIVHSLWQRSLSSSFGLRRSRRN